MGGRMTPDSYGFEVEAGHHIEWGAHPHPPEPQGKEGAKRRGESPSGLAPDPHQPGQFDGYRSFYEHWLCRDGRTPTWSEVEEMLRGAVSMTDLRRRTISHGGRSAVMPEPVR
jgi:hypothetical protein